MRIKTKNYGYPKDSISKQLTYLPNLAVYPNTTDMKELSEFRFSGSSILKRLGSIRILWRERS